MSKGNTKMVPIISAGAMLGAFANLASGNFFTAEGSLTFTNAPAIATIAGCVIMMVLVKLSRARDRLAQGVGICNCHVQRHVHRICCQRNLRRVRR